MANPQTSIKKFLFRIGKQIEPVIRLPDDCSIVDIRTTTVRDENYVVDTYKAQAWEIAPGQKVHAIYIDGIFKGHGHFVTDEGVAVEMKREIPVPQSTATVRPVSMDKNYSILGKVATVNKDVVLKSSKDTGKVITARYEGHIGTLSAINMIQRGSVLQPSMWSTIVWCLVSGLMGAFVIGPMIMR